MNETRFKRLRKWLPEVLIGIVLIGGVHWFRTQDMLNADNEPAPELALPSLQGLPGGLAVADPRPAVVYFFAPWCNFCAASAHNLRNLRRLRSEEELQIVLVALDWQDVDEVRDYIERHELDNQVLLGTRETADTWGVSVFPTYYVIDGEHRVVHRDYGYSTLLGLWLRSILAS